MAILDPAIKKPDRKVIAAALLARTYGEALAVEAAEIDKIAGTDGTEGSPKPLGGPEMVQSRLNAIMESCARCNQLLTWIVRVGKTIEDADGCDPTTKAEMMTTFRARHAQAERDWRTASNNAGHAQRFLTFAESLADEMDEVKRVVENDTEWGGLNSTTKV